MNYTQWNVHVQTHSVEIYNKYPLSQNRVRHAAQIRIPQTKSIDYANNVDGLRYKPFLNVL